MIAIPVLITVCIAAFVTLLIYLSQKHEKQRVAELKTIAEKLGLESVEHQSRDLVEGLENQFKLFNRGRQRAAKNLLRAATEELEITVFDYRYVTGSGKSRHTHTQSVLLMRSPHIAVTRFLVRPEGVLDSIGSALGFQDIDFDDHPAFSSSFVLQGEESAIRNEFQHEILDWFAHRKGTYAEGVGESLILCRKNRRIKPDELKDQIELAYSCSALFRKDRN